MVWVTAEPLYSLSHKLKSLVTSLLKLYTSGVTGQGRRNAIRRGGAWPERGGQKKNSNMPKIVRMFID